MCYRAAGWQGDCQVSAATGGWQVGRPGRRGMPLKKSCAVCKPGPATIATACCVVNPPPNCFLPSTFRYDIVLTTFQLATQLHTLRCAQQAEKDLGVGPTACNPAFTDAHCACPASCNLCWPLACAASPSGKPLADRTQPVFVNVLLSAPAGAPAATSAANHHHFFAPAATSGGGASSRTSRSCRRAASWRTRSTAGWPTTSGCSPARPSTPRVGAARWPLRAGPCAHRLLKGRPGTMAANCKNPALPLTAGPARSCRDTLHCLQLFLLRSGEHQPLHAVPGHGPVRHALPPLPARHHTVRTRGGCWRLAGRAKAQGYRASCG